MDEQLRRRVVRHAALAEPHRLAIVDELQSSDRSPRELAERLDLPTNLLAHHLDVLEGAGVIERTVSSHDRRRRYVRLRHESLVDLVPATKAPTSEVLFVCTHNSARSPTAAALWARHSGHRASSAGTHPAARVHPGAVAAARRAGIDLRRSRPRLLTDTEDAVLVITVCDRAHEELQPPSTWWHWSVPDPAQPGTDEAFDEALRVLDDRIRTLLDSLEA